MYQLMFFKRNPIEFLLIVNTLFNLLSLNNVKGNKSLNIQGEVLIWNLFNFLLVND